jgi:beta-lactamase class A
MRHLLVLMLIAFATLGCGGAWAADPSAEERVLLELFGTGPITADLFTPDFLAQAPLTQIQQAFGKERAVVGPALRVEKVGPGYVVHTENYAVPVEIGLDAAGKVASFVLRQAVRSLTTIDDVRQVLAEVKGQVSYLVTKNNTVLYAQGQRRPLAVSSAFKLAVLAALKEAIAAGSVKWEQVVKLDPHDISFTPGVLQDFAPGSPVTVHSLAALMMAESDNTAADQLTDLVGRDKVAAQLGTAFALKTTEFYKLKADPARQLRYANGDAKARAAIAGELDGLPMPKPGDVTTPLTDQVEWYLSSTDLCRLVGEVADLDMVGINPGVARRDSWAKIAFKGGSEVGVVSLTSQLTSAAGDNFCVTLTVNDHAPLDEDRLTTIYAALVNLLAK